MTSTTDRKRVAVIGAGAAGVCSAKYMVEAGFDVTVYEAGSHIGGLWVFENDNGRSQAYKNLSIISSRRYTRFRDMGFDDATPQFPTHRDMARYLRQYADRFGVTPRIRFQTPVESVQPAFDRGEDAEPRWVVTTQDGDEDSYNAVFVATGHLNEPLHVDELRAFEGEYLHSSAYRVPAPYAGKRMCVVGTGNSGVDIASDVCATAERTVLVARSGVDIKPKVFAGIPFADIAISLRKKWIPARLRNRIVQTVVHLAHGDLRRLGIQKPTARTHPTLSESIVSHIEFNRVHVKPAIQSIEGQKITFLDGSIEEFDVLVAATGYKVHLPFIPDEIVPVNGNHVDLYKRIFVPEWPGLCFVGMINPLSTLNRILEHQSELLVDYVAGRVTLPPPDDMWHDIQEKEARSRAIYTDSPRHEMEEPDFAYVEELHQVRADGSFRNIRLPEPLDRPWVRRVLWRARGALERFRRQQVPAASGR